jgi:hypothetical protein
MPALIQTHLFSSGGMIGNLAGELMASSCVFEVPGTADRDKIYIMSRNLPPAPPPQDQTSKTPLIQAIRSHPLSPCPTG